MYGIIDNSEKRKGKQPPNAFPIWSIKRSYIQRQR